MSLLEGSEQKQPSQASRQVHRGRSSDGRCQINLDLQAENKKLPQNQEQCRDRNPDEGLVVLVSGASSKRRKGRRQKDCVRRRLSGSGGGGFYLIHSSYCVIFIFYFYLGFLLASGCTPAVGLIRVWICWGRRGVSCPRPGLPPGAVAGSMLCSTWMDETGRKGRA